MKMFKLSTIMVVVTMLALSLCTFPQHANAQSGNVIREFVNDPYMPVLTAAPANTLTTASLTLHYTGNPVAGNTIAIKGTGYSEFYEFYTPPTYTGANVGLPIGTTSDVTATSATAIINAKSNLVKVTTVTAGTTDTIAFKAKKVGVQGNGITIVHDDDNLTTGTMSGGASPRYGDKGTFVAEFSSGTIKLWVRSSSTDSTGVWMKPQ